MTKIRVLIVDDHPVVRHGLKNMLNSVKDIEVVGEAETSEQALEQVSQLLPDVVLLDIRMPGASGLRVVQSLQRAHPKTKIIILTSYDNDEHLFEALRAGAHGYLLKSVAHEKLTGAIRSVHSGERLLSPDLVGRVLEEFQSLAQQRVSEEHRLERDEVQILRLIAAGHTNRDIAEELYWSEVTVKRKVADIFAKLDVGSRTEAVAKALKKGII
jgi:NarL family two-component system response regulator LiaR